MRIGASSFFSATEGLATIEYIIGAAVVLGTLVIGVTSWNNGLVARLRAFVGRGALVAIREHRDRLRASDRAKSLDAAGRVEGRLMLVLVLCYLPR